MASTSAASVKMSCIARGQAEERSSQSGCSGNVLIPLRRVDDEGSYRTVSCQQSQDLESLRDGFRIAQHFPCESLPFRQQARGGEPRRQFGSKFFLLANIRTNNPNPPLFTARARHATTKGCAASATSGKIVFFPSPSAAKARVKIASLSENSFTVQPGQRLTSAREKAKRRPSIWETGITPSLLLVRKHSSAALILSSEKRPSRTERHSRNPLTHDSLAHSDVRRGCLQKCPR